MRLEFIINGNSEIVEAHPWEPLREAMALALSRAGYDPTYRPVTDWEARREDGFLVSPKTTPEGAMLRQGDLVFMSLAVGWDG